MNNWQRLLVGGLIFFTPSNLFWKITTQPALASGQFVDYLIPKLFISDLIILGLFIGWSFSNITIFLKLKSQLSKLVTKISHGFGPLILALSSTLIFSQLLGSWLQTSWWLLKLLELGWVGWWLSQNWPKNHNFFKAVIITTIWFQVGLASWQFWWQRSLLPYQWLGETNLLSTAGIAKFTWNGNVLILPYGTTAHPNILAATLVILTLLLGWSGWLSKLTKLISVPILVITGSWSAWLMATNSLIFKSIKSRWWLLMFSLLMLVIVPALLALAIRLGNNHPSINRRHYLNQMAVQLWLTQPGLGLGPNQFVTNLAHRDTPGENSRFVQPAHHLPLLGLVEWGIAGWLILSMGYFTLNQIQRTKIWIMIIFLWPALALDHYLLTNQTGWLLLVWMWLFANHQVEVKRINSL